MRPAPPTTIALLAPAVLPKETNPPHGRDEALAAGVGDGPERLAVVLGDETHLGEGRTSRGWG